MNTLIASIVQHGTYFNEILVVIERPEEYKFDEINNCIVTIADHLYKHLGVIATEAKFGIGKLQLINASLEKDIQPRINEIIETIQR